ncbi:histidine phosphatase family protein [Rhodococcus koreensis]
MNETARPIPAPDSTPSTRDRIHRALLIEGLRTEVVLIRHAQQVSPSRTEPRSVHLDPPLSDVGLEQADAVAAHLSREQFSAIYCSDLERARETAMRVARAGSSVLDPVVLTGLREIDVFGFGDDSLPDPTVDELSAASDEFLRTRRWEAFPHSERSDDFRARVYREIEQLALHHDGERFAVVAHGGVISAFLAAAFEIREDMFFYAAHTSVTRAFHGDGRWAMHTVNEIDHVRSHNLVSY